MNDGIAQLQTALGTHSTGGMFAERRVLGHVEQTHVLAIALDAQLDETVAVQLGQLASIDARTQVQTVAVLRHHMFDVAGANQRAQRHVRVRGLYASKVGTRDLDAFGQHGP